MGDVLVGVRTDSGVAVTITVIANGCQFCPAQAQRMKPLEPCKDATGGGRERTGQVLLLLILLILNLALG